MNKHTTEKIMKDGSTAHLSSSGRYYVRLEPRASSFEKIVYYTLTGEYIQLAKATCSECQQTIESQRCGDFKYCECGESFVDTDRWFPERHRFGGKAIPCTEDSHKDVYCEAKLKSRNYLCGKKVYVGGLCKKHHIEQYGNFE